MNCEYCDWLEDDEFGVAPYLLHLFMKHDNKFNGGRKTRKLPKYKHRQVYRMTEDKLDWLIKISKGYHDKKITKVACKTCLNPFKTGQVVVTANGSRSLRHLSCAKRVLYV